MPIRILYEAAIDVGTGHSTAEDVTSRVRLYTLDLAQNAEEGSVAISSITFDDPLGDYDIKGWRRVWAYEDTATGSNTLMYLGWVAPDRNVSRGPFVLGSARVWETSLSDMNALISMRVFSTPTANRPAESDVARINWLMGTNEMSRITETEYISAGNAKNMDAVDYRGQTLIDVINDCAQQSGKNFFVYNKQTGASTTTRGLWYDFPYSTAYSSPLRLSNVLADVDNNFTFAMAEDTTLVRDASRTYSGAYVRYDGGAVYEESISTSNLFTRRDAVYEAANVKNATTATNRAIRYLGQSDDEEDRIKTAFWVPAEKVNFVKPGMRIQFKASHLPGYAGFVWGRVLKHQIKEISEIDEAGGVKYLVSLELSTAAGVVIGGGCSTNGGTLTIHTFAHASFPDAKWRIWTGANATLATIKVDNIAAGDYTYDVTPGECFIYLEGISGGQGVPFDGITWTPSGGSPTDYAENGDGNAGHFLTYTNSIFQTLGTASQWSFPVYGYSTGGRTGDYGLGLNNGVAFLLP